MRTYKTKKIESRYLSEVICDLCGQRSKDTNWASSDYTQDEPIITIVKHTQGYNTPDGGSGIEYGADLCPNCFKTKLVPWLTSQGCKSNYEEWDW